jgi:hypothetical protein
VIAIEPDADHKMYTITAKHWEPETYINAVKEQEAKRALRNAGKYASKGVHLGPQLLFGASSGLAVGAVVLKKGFPFLAQMLPEYAVLCQQLAAEPVLVYAATVTVCLLLVLLVRAIMGEAAGIDRVDKKKVTSAVEIPSVGKMGDASRGEVTVPEMMVGGSGSQSVMKGEEVALEYIRARYVVNAAGCSSVRFKQTPVPNLLNSFLPWVYAWCCFSVMLTSIWLCRFSQRFFLCFFCFVFLFFLCQCTDFLMHFVPLSLLFRTKLPPWSVTNPFTSNHVSETTCFSIEIR